MNIFDPDGAPISYQHLAQLAPEPLTSCPDNNPDCPTCTPDGEPTMTETPIYDATLEAHTDAAVDSGDEPLLDQLYRMDERTTPIARAARHYTDPERTDR